MRKDGAEMSRWVTADITELGPDHESPIAGKEKFFERYQPYFTGPLTIVSYRIIRPRALRLSARLSLIYFGYRMQTSDGCRLCDSRGKESILVERSAARWRVKFIHWHEDASNTAQPANQA
jgi:hypothetical protein